jgi:hypothetical protein
VTELKGNSKARDSSKDKKQLSPSKKDAAQDCKMPISWLTELKDQLRHLKAMNDF